ncbi:hypothetical protein [Actinoplanes teichomyceticus]|uniref:Uncharacterized protein n=1 Tax=Actinoplanes teichomyceticus TaxID=1867 RepID=A0A561VMU4_ACTTI|nr:hypothetical protein [Actinoplanes teichomyceticus]TWG12923.1 hypothetical protein FHX34_105791 [Actinoplanes teichomyceticus]
MYPQGPLDDAAVKRARNNYNSALQASDLPIFAVSEDFQPCFPRLMGWGGVNAAVNTATVAYDSLANSEMWIAVTTARWAGTATRSASLETVLAEQARQRGMLIPTTFSGSEEIDFFLESGPVQGYRINASGDLWAARCETGGIEITIVSHGWRPERVAVNTFADRGSFLTRQAQDLPPLERQGVPVAEPPTGWAEPGCPGQDPIRALVEVTLSASEATVTWMEVGGAPPPQVADLTALWQAAARRHMALTGHDESDSKRAVTSIVNHMLNLRASAAWFRNRADLRRRAISETLIFGTELRADVPSHRAHRAWQKIEEPLSITPEGAVALAAAKNSWRKAWAAWAAASESALGPGENA